MGIWESLVLAIVQGLTEFLPVSSSGHLVVGGHLLDLPLDGKGKAAFFVLLHAASLLAVVVHLFGDIKEVVLGERRRWTLLALFVGCIPAGIGGILIKCLDGEALFETPLVVGIAWIATAVLLFTTRRDRCDEEARWTPFGAEGQIRYGPILLIGLAQALALVPGISRSGSTIATALLLCMTAQAGFRFSFLMAVPLIGGAMCLELPALGHVAEVASASTLAIAFLACFLVSWGCLILLRRMVDQNRLHWFAPYCLLAGIVTIAATLL